MSAINDGKLHTGAGTVRAPGLERRQHNQHARVAAGVADGGLDQNELQAIHGQRQGYRADLAAAKADDGHVDLQERRELHQDLNGISGSIRTYRNNA